MKKILVVVLCLAAFSFAAIRVQGQADLVGLGYGIGLGQEVVPMFLTAGIEGSVYNLPSVKNSGSYEGVAYDGTLNLSMARFGGWMQLKFPVADMLPILGPLFHPIFHFGTQNGIISVDGSVRPVNNGIPVEGSSVVRGSYCLVGFPSYIGPFFIEPAIGSQHIFIPHFGNYKNTIDAQIAAGLSF